MNSTTCRSDIPPMENIILPIEYDPYILFYEEINEIRAKQPMYLELKSSNQLHRMDLSNKATIYEIFRKLDILAGKFLDDQPRAISSYKCQNRILVFELEQA